MCFYLFGASSYTPLKILNQKKQIHFRIVKFFPKAFHMLFTVCYVIQLIWHSNIVMTAGYFSAAVFSATHIATVVDDISSVRKIRKMLLALFDSVTFLNNKMRVLLCLKTFEKNYRFKFFLTIIINTLFFLIKFLTDGDHLTLENITVFLLLIYKMIAIFQVIFFIDFKNLILFSMNEHLKSLHCDLKILLIKSNSNDCTNTLKYVKTIHFNMWKVAELISARFGWFMIVFLLELVFVPCVSIFTVFVILTTDNEVSGIGRYTVFSNYYPRFLCLFIFLCL